jgi:competence protein ComGC
METIKSKFKSIHFSTTLVLMLITIFLIIISIGIIINCMIEYKYTIDNNYNNADIVLSMKTRSIEINSVLFLSKVLIGYFLVIIGYLWYQLKNK